MELASEQPISQVTVADLAERARVTRATFYNHYASPLELLIQVLLADLQCAHLHEEERRAEGGLSAAQGNSDARPPGGPSRLKENASSLSSTRPVHRRRRRRPGHLL